MRPSLLRFAVPSLALALACSPADTPEATDSTDMSAAGEADTSRPLPDGAQAWSLLGEPLRPPELSDEVRASHEANLAAAEADAEADPTDVEAIIWYGRRLAYLGRYREAIAVFTRGIALHPDDARLYRHRGHRFITVREFDRAIEDFLTAVDLIQGQDDEVEPDGLPNAQGIPTSTLHFNIWYHLGLAHYLQGDLERALLAWNDCLAASRHADSVVATSYWLNNTLRRLGLDSEADEVLANISADMDIIESTSYLDVLLLHKGERSAEDLLGPSGGEVTLASTTTAYGVAVWHLVNGRRDTAFGVFEGIVDNRAQWPAFGYVSAEADVARMRSGEAAN